MAINMKQDKSAFVFRINTINKLQQLRNALKHNKREIQAELGARGHIKPELVKHNYSLLEKKSASETFSIVKKDIKTYQENQCKRIRTDAVVAIEILFSLPAIQSEINTKQYFTDCLNWSIEQFQPGKVLSADVHLDESNPHMHVIFSCIGSTQLLGSKLKGNRKKFADRQLDFYNNVAQKHGLYMPASKINKTDRLILGKKITAHLETINDPLVSSPSYSIVKNMIFENPTPFAQMYDFEIAVKPKRMKTMTQIFTSKGKGPTGEKETDTLPV